MKSNKWNERVWSDAFEGWQFRSYRTARAVQICLNVENFQGDGLFHLSFHLNKRALAFEFPFDCTNPAFTRFQWKLKK